MKAHLLSCTAALLSTLPLYATTPTGPITDGMPLQGDRAAELAQRIKELEKRLEAAEKGQAVARGPVAPHELSADIDRTLKYAHTLLQSGEDVAASKAFEDALQEALARLKPNPQALHDTFLTCFSLVQAADKLVTRGERALARTLLEDVLRGLRLCQETMPGWNPAIIKYRLGTVEKQLSELR